MAAKPFLFNILVYIYKHWWDLNLGSSVQHPELFTKISNDGPALIGSEVPKFEKDKNYISCKTKLKIINQFLIDYIILIGTNTVPQL